MDHDRSTRRLTSLIRSASTARLLNLADVHSKFGNDPTLAEKPFFNNRRLNHSIILKHRLQPHEFQEFLTLRQTATKVLIPIDVNDLKIGAGGFFIGQKNFDQIAEDVFTGDLKQGSRDRQILELIDTLPSLDPFLLREALRLIGIEPARQYFGLSDSDMQRMFEFVRTEIKALANLSLRSNADANVHASKFVEKLMSTSHDGFEPLRLVLRMNDAKYMDGVFAWKGFLYYKWVLTDLNVSIGNVITDIGHIEGRGPKDFEASAYIPGARTRILDAIVNVRHNITEIINIYNRAYADLTVAGKPNTFREFLISSPRMFATLGERLGALQHISSFWRYRFPVGKPKLITPEELMGIFLDFEASLEFKQPRPQ